MTDWRYLLNRCFVDNLNGTCSVDNEKYLNLLATEIATSERRIKQMELDAGWNDSHIYNRDWKNNLRVEKKNLKELVSAQKLAKMPVGRN